VAVQGDVRRAADSVAADSDNDNDADTWSATTWMSRDARDLYSR